VRRRVPVLLFLVIAGVECAVLFVPAAASAFFLFDDYAHLDVARSVPLGELFRTPVLGLFRPVTIAAFKAQYALFGFAGAPGYAAVCAILNLVNAVLLAFVLRAFGENEVVRWLAATFFLVFPPANEAHVWFCCEFDLLAVTGTLVSLLLAASALRGDTGKRRRLLLGALSVGSLFLALLAKESVVAAPLLLAALAVGHRRRPAIAPPGSLLAAAVFSALPLGAFLVLRAGILPLTRTHYGSTIELFRQAPLLRNLGRYAVAMFTYPYFGASAGAAVFAHGAGLLAMVAVLLGLRAVGLKGGVAAVAAGLGFLLPVLWTPIVPGAAFGGRLVYAAALPLAFLFSTGVDSAWAAIREAGGAAGGATLRWTGAALLTAFVLGTWLAGLSLGRYWGDAFALARSVMSQVERLGAPSSVFIRNLPRQFVNGPYVLKCYAFPIYLGSSPGAAPSFRCDGVDVVRKGIEILEAGPREPDVFSPRFEPRADERTLELNLQIRAVPGNR